MSNVSRSVYQKKCEENKKMLHDLKALVGMMRPEDERRAWYKWRYHFEKEAKFNSLVKVALKINQTS